MLSDIFLALVNMFVVEPAQAELGRRLEQLRAPPAIIRDVSDCLSAARPVLIEAYIEDPVRGVLTVVRLWTGLTTYDAVLQDEVPACKPALQAARPYLERVAS